MDKKSLLLWTSCEVIFFIIFLISGLGLTDYGEGVGDFFSTKVDITETHDLYLEIKDITKLEDLEALLDKNNVNYNISKDIISFKHLNFKIEGENVHLNNNNIIDAFNQFESGSIDTNVEFNGNEKIETSIVGMFTRVNDKYYYNRLFFYIIALILSTVVTLLTYVLTNSAVYSPY